MIPSQAMRPSAPNVFSMPRPLLVSIDSARSCAIAPRPFHPSPRHHTSLALSLYLAPFARGPPIDISRPLLLLKAPDAHSSCTITVTRHLLRLLARLVRVSAIQGRFRRCYRRDNGRILRSKRAPRSARLLEFSRALRSLRLEGN